VVNSKIEIIKLSDAMDGGYGYIDDKFFEL